MIPLRRHKRLKFILPEENLIPKPDKKKLLIVYYEYYYSVPKTAEGYLVHCSGEARGSSRVEVRRAR